MATFEPSGRRFPNYLPQNTGDFLRSHPPYSYMYPLYLQQPLQPMAFPPLLWPIQPMAFTPIQQFQPMALWYTVSLMTGIDIHIPSPRKVNIVNPNNHQVIGFHITCPSIHAPLPAPEGGLAHTDADSSKPDASLASMEPTSVFREEGSPFRETFEGSVTVSGSSASDFSEARVTDTVYKREDLSTPTEPNAEAGVFREEGSLFRETFDGSFMVSGSSDADCFETRVVETVYEPEDPSTPTEPNAKASIFREEGSLFRETSGSVTISGSSASDGFKTRVAATVYEEGPSTTTESNGEASVFKEEGSSFPETFDGSFVVSGSSDSAFFESRAADAGKREDRSTPTVIDSTESLETRTTITTDRIGTRRNQERQKTQNDVRRESDTCCSPSSDRCLIKNQSFERVEPNATVQRKHDLEFSLKLGHLSKDKPSNLREIEIDNRASHRQSRYALISIKTSAYGDTCISGFTMTCRNLSAHGARSAIKKPVYRSGLGSSILTSMKMYEGNRK